MGLQCSILGHAFEDAGVEREREERGSEVVTTEREIERCRRCGTERVVSENTEVAAVVDADDVGIETGDGEADSDATNGTGGGGVAGAVERSGTPENEGAEVESDAPGGGGSAETAPPDISGVEGAESEEEPPSPAEEDAEILTDEDEPERQPGQWPDDADGDTEPDDDVESDIEGEPLEPADDSLSGLTVPDGEIVCPDCSFRIEASSGYREGDPCPECNAWLETERNQ